MCSLNAVSLRDVAQMPKNFYVGGPIRRKDHYYVPRDDEINSIVQKLLSDDNNFVLLHAHRQAGKSSLLLPITELLEAKEHVVLSIPFKELEMMIISGNHSMSDYSYFMVSKVSNFMMLPDS